MPPQITVILNSASGSVDAGRIRRELTDACAAEGCAPTIAIVPGHEISMVAQRAVRDGNSVIVAGGGDGTVSTIASVLAGTDVILGVLPLGTLNHFAKDLRIPLDIKGAVRTIVGGRIVRTDIGEVNGRQFVNNSSIGLYPRLVWEREKERRTRRSRWTASAHAVLHVWRRYRRVRVAMRSGGRNRIVRTPFVFVGNNEYELEGILFGGRRSLSDGCLQICLAPGMTRLEVVGVLLSALVGRLSNVEHFEAIRTTECSIGAWRRRLHVSLDGELAVLRTPLRFRIRPGALRVLVPAHSRPADE